MDWEVEQSVESESGNADKGIGGGGGPWQQTGMIGCCHSRAS